MMSLVACSDPCGRVWIQDAGQGTFPLSGLHIRFPQHRKNKRALRATLALARKMAAADELVAALEASTAILVKDRADLVASVAVPSTGYIPDEDCREAVEAYDELIAANNAVLAVATESPS